MTQSVKGLLNKNNTYGATHAAAHACPSTGRQDWPLEHGGWVVHPKLSSEFRERPCLKKRWRAVEEDFWYTSDLHMYAQTHPDTCASLHPSTERKPLRAMRVCISKHVSTRKLKLK